MSRELIEKLAAFKGKQVIGCIDEITKIAAGYSINVMDPEFNTAAIDEDRFRLNVRTNKASAITSFTIG